MKEWYCKQPERVKRFWGVGYKRRGFQIVKKGVSVYGMKSAKRMKCRGRKRSWLDGKFGENREVI